MNIEEYKTDRLRVGAEFEDYAHPIVYRWGIFSMPYRSAKFQWRAGEGMAGVEYKRDRKAVLSWNLFIETDECWPGESWRRAGPFHEHRPVWICIGDVDDFVMLIDAQVLRLLCGKWKKLKYVETPTSKGYLFKMVDAVEWACLLYDPKKRFHP